MSCCETLPICVGGKTYYAQIIKDPQGGFLSGAYIDENLLRVDIVAGTFSFGACSATSAASDVFRVIQPLAAGNNVINHNLGFSSVEVEVRNNANGAVITASVIAETPTSVTVFVPVAVASARISIDA